MAYGHPVYIIKIVGFTTVAAVTLVNCLSVKLATAVQNVFCFCKLLAIGIIIGGGLYMLGTGHYGNIVDGDKVADRYAILTKVCESSEVFNVIIWNSG